ncbi:glycosyltransferase [Paenibacillus woosongensis]|uniref:Glycosyltransferase n=1 Tax=Paenibacillus woosongensis TaxID=307580 RepID=A0A7X2Z1S9_9BACL|nr:glycosyltransferase [Paenibacillus woosongensis]MUG45281.1 glycosyltransferase [Paenibacillus woosongensis]
MEISVVIPVYNQSTPLKLTLEGYCNQTINRNIFEIIVVDDGSDDPLELDEWKERLQIKVIRQQNLGRAIARNTGIESSDGELIIFNDADRIPCSEFIEIHLASHKKNGNCVVIGNPKELYISNLECRVNEILSYIKSGKITRFARKYLYSTVISHLFKEEGGTDSVIPWMGFFSGNSSVRRDDLRSAGMFNPKFKEWGFEHFELGYRLFHAGHPFRFAANGVNYHLAHQRNTSFYKEHFKYSASLFSEIQQDVRILKIYNFLVGELSLQGLEELFGGHSNTINSSEDIYFSSFNG